MRGDHLGEFEELTLLSVRALPPPAYALPVQRFIHRTTGRDVALGAVYAALDRLEQKGLVHSSIGQATPERGGKAKRLFAVSPAGTQMLRELRGVRERIWKRIEERS
ncbi:MAG: PadR family transcriptional regulator [Vicinamibacterales bacterium]